jgi:hypothetical protein
MAPIFTAGQAQERLRVQGARCKEKQSMRYDVQPCTVYLGPCTVCWAARGDYEENGAVQREGLKPLPYNLLIAAWKNTPGVLRLR